MENLCIEILIFTDVKEIQEFVAEIYRTYRKSKEIGQFSAEMGTESLVHSSCLLW